MSGRIYLQITVYCECKKFSANDINSSATFYFICCLISERI